jgi:hypothetical protein
MARAAGDRLRRGTATTSHALPETGGDAAARKRGHASSRHAARICWCAVDVASLNAFCDTRGHVRKRRSGPKDPRRILDMGVDESVTLARHPAWFLVSNL